MYNANWKHKPICLSSTVLSSPLEFFASEDSTNPKHVNQIIFQKLIYIYKKKYDSVSV